VAEFLVSPPERTRWSLPVEDFGRVVLERWPRAGLRRWGGGSHLRASAWIKAPSAWDDLLLELHGNGSTLGIDARDQLLAAEAACWWRRVVPAEIPVLWLYDRGFSGYSEIWPHTAPAEVFSPR
jgi:hypothetical protein